MSLSSIANYIADSVEKRAANGDNFGVAIIPEGIVEFVPEFSVLIAEINELLAGSKTDAFNALPSWNDKYEFIKNGLTPASFAVFDLLPVGIQQQLFLERDPHGNVQVSLIESEKLFSALVKDELAKRKLQAHTTASSAHCITSSDMKEDVHSHLTSMQTTATHLVTTHSC